MRAAPPVQMACGRDARWSAAVAALTALSAATLVTWLGWQFEWPLTWRWLPALAVAAVLGGRTWRRLQHGPERRLTWDGSAWALDETPADVELMIDLGDWLLLRVTTAADGLAHWLPLGLAGGARHRCRAALLAHAGRAAA